MGSVWKRLQRVNKRAAKFQFTASYHELRVETTAKWRPTNLSVVWTRRSRRVASAPLPWEPDMVNPLIGHVHWPVPDNHAISVTLFKDPRTHEMEDKDWTFVLEDITQMGKKRVLASASINMRKYASIEPTQQSFNLTLKTGSRKITLAELELTISCVFLREGKATDEDMQSVVSLMSVNNNCDVAPLDDLEDMPDLENPDISEHMLDFTQQLEQMTSSLNGCLDLSTPMSVPSLSEDPTPLAENNHLNFELELDKSIEEEDDSQKTPSVAAALPIAASTPIKIKTPANEVAKENVSIKPKVVGAEIKKGQICLETNDKKLDVERLRYNKVELFKVPLTIVDPKTKVEDKNRRSMEVTIKVTQNEEKKKDRAIVLDTEPELSHNEIKDNKRNELQPLDLKKNYSNTNGNDVNKSSAKIEKIILKERTPGQDLLEWCKEVTRDYPNVKVTNLTTSWRNGIAFCAIIHHFEPDLIDMTKMASHDVVSNCRMAFDAAEKLGIPRVIEPTDMSLLAVPDKLAVMTYLHQLRAHFTGKQLHIEQFGETCEDSSYVIGDYKSDIDRENVLNFSHLRTTLLHQNSFDNDDGMEKLPPSPTKKDVKNIIISGSKNLLVKVLSPAKEKTTLNAFQNTNSTTGIHMPPANNNHNSINLNNEHQQQMNEQNHLMTRRELNDPFGSDDDDEYQNKDVQNEDNCKNNFDNQLNSPALSLDIKLVSRHIESSEKSKAIREKFKLASAEKIDKDNERQQKLQELARQLIADTRHKSLDSPTSPTRKTAFEYINNKDAKKTAISPTKKINNEYEKYSKHSPSHIFNNEKNGNSPLQSFNAVFERISPKTEKRGDKLTYIESELESLEREQEAIDQKASSLEKKLRAVMGGNPSNNTNYSKYFLRLLKPRSSKPRLKIQDLIIHSSGSDDDENESDNDADDENEDLKKLNNNKLIISGCDNSLTNNSNLNSNRRHSRSRSHCGGETEETEEQLLAQWFTLVNKKNALLRRQMQLNILEQESDLERRYALLNQELRAAQSVEDWRKSEAQREKEKLLLEELVSIVDKRDQLVQHLHNQEIAIEDDDEIAREVETVDISDLSGKEKCVIQ